MEGDGIAQQSCFDIIEVKDLSEEPLIALFSKSVLHNVGERQCGMPVTRRSKTILTKAAILFFRISAKSSYLTSIEKKGFDNFFRNSVSTFFVISKISFTSMSPLASAPFQNRLQHVL